MQARVLPDSGRGRVGSRRLACTAETGKRRQCPIARERENGCMVWDIFRKREAGHGPDFDGRMVRKAFCGKFQVGIS